MNCGDCEKCRVEQMGNGREMLFCTVARRHVGAALASGSGKAVLGYGVHPAWCGVGIRRPDGMLNMTGFSPEGGAPAGAG